MTFEQEILVNKFGQALVKTELLLNIFKHFSLEEKRFFLNDILFLIIQSKAVDSDIEDAILCSTLKSTYTPCIMIRKGVAAHNLEKLIVLPEKELDKVLLLMLSLFRIAYRRRFLIEKDDPDKWWYWDLSDEAVIQSIKQKYSR